MSDPDRLPRYQIWLHENTSTGSTSRQVDAVRAEDHDRLAATWVQERKQLEQDVESLKDTILRQDRKIPSDRTPGPLSGGLHLVT